MKLHPIPLCECGCGGFANIGKRFICGHNPHSDEWRSKQSKRMMGNKFALGIRFKRPESWKKGQSRRMMGKKNGLGFKHTEEWIKAHSEKMMGNKLNLGKKRNEESKQKQRAAMKRVWSDPVWHKKQSSKMSQGNNIRPNKLEREILKLLNCLFPEDWKYVGDGDLVISGKNPDFVNEKRKLIIEAWGAYWHKGQNPKDRIAVFKPYGYKTLIIWDYELKNISGVIKRILRFSKRAAIT